VSVCTVFLKCDTNAWQVLASFLGFVNSFGVCQKQYCPTRQPMSLGPAVELHGPAIRAWLCAKTPASKVLMMIIAPACVALPGHWKLNHTRQLFVIQNVLMLLQFAMFTVFQKNTKLLASFGFPSDTEGAYLSFLLFNFLLSPLSEVSDQERNRLHFI
jgi:Peptidase family M48